MNIKKYPLFTRIAPECHPCMINQSRSAARIAELGQGQTDRVVKAAEAALEEARMKPLLVQHIVRRVTDTIIRELGESPEFDIYSEIKDKSNDLALAYANRFQEKIDDSESPLETGLQIAAAGNIIDFGAGHYDFKELEKELQSLNETTFEHYDIEPLEKALKKAVTLLYLCDNSGEIVFDMLFMKEMKRQFPQLQITACLREKPIINDATLKDAKAVGLDRTFKSISSGSIYPGTILSETSREFQNLFESADIILSKGQGNFETLYHLAEPRLFFLLRIKCEHMASLSGVKSGALVLIQGSNLTVS